MGSECPLLPALGLYLLLHRCSEERPGSRPRVQGRPGLGVQKTLPGGEREQWEELLGRGLPAPPLRSRSS